MGAADRENGKETQPISYVIPSVAVESKSLEMESKPGISDSSATLGMTYRGGTRNDIGGGLRPRNRHSRVSGNPGNNARH